MILSTVGGMRGCQGECVWLPGGVHGCQGACVVAGGSVWLQGVCMVAGGVHGCQGACMVPGGHAWFPWGMHGCRGMCVVAVILFADICNSVIDTCDLSFKVILQIAHRSLLIQLIITNIVRFADFE